MKRIVLSLIVLFVFLVGCGKTESQGEIDDIQDENIVQSVKSEEERIEAEFENNQKEACDNSVTERNLEILDNCRNIKMEQTFDVADGTTFIINADVNVSGITRVSQYEYILTDINEEKREALFESVFAETKNKAEYDELNNVWTIELDSERRNYFLYQISYSNGGKTIPGEQIIILENRYYDLYPFEDNRLDSLLDSKVDIVLDDVKNMCEQVVDSIIDTDDYAIDYIYAYGNNGRRPYYKVVFKRMLDGMPVTTHNNLTFLVDNDGIEMVKGSLFSIKETGLEEIIISPEEAVTKLREQAEYLNFEEESQVFVSEVMLEYFVVISQDGGILVTPIWRFGIGKDEGERNSMRHKILAIDAVTGELIWEEREHTM